MLGWKALGHEKGLGAHIVNYADDFVICCRGNAQEALAVMRDMMSKLKLTVNEAKTHVCRMPQDTFDFLGYTFGRLYSPRTGGAYIGGRPSGKRVVRVCGEVSRLTDPRTTGLHVSLVVARLNRVIDGWANYFRLGTVSRAYRAVEQHTCRRLRRWLARKHKVRSGMKTLFTGQYLHRTLGLVDLGTRKGQPLVC